MQVLWIVLGSFSLLIGIISLRVFTKFRGPRNSKERWQMLLEKRKGSDKGNLRTMSEDQLRNLIEKTYRVSLITFIVCALLFTLSMIEIFIVK